MYINEKLSHSGNYGGYRSLDSIKFIVIHYTGNKGDTSSGNASYFHNNKIGTSAHYFVDESSIWRSVPDSVVAYHCGGRLQSTSGHSFYKICTNSNSIGVEMCLLDKSGNIRQNTIYMTISLVKTLMKKYGIPASNVIRHWDVVGKSCPAPMTGNNNALWNSFKHNIAEEDIDMEELARLQQEFEAYKQQYNDTIYNLKCELQAANNKINEMNIKYDTFDDLPDWSKSAINKLLERQVISADSINMGYDLVRSFVLLDRLGVIKSTSGIYNTLEEIPEWGKSTISKLLDMGILKGTSSSELNIGEDMLRILVILDRAEVFENTSKVNSNKK